jgi:hypothetical protein
MKSITRNRLLEIRLVCFCRTRAAKLSSNFDTDGITQASYLDGTTRGQEEVRLDEKCMRAPGCHLPSND